jgi:hypothetical protein
VKVGDLVTATHWGENQTAIVVDVSRLDHCGVVSVYSWFGRMDETPSYVGDYMAYDLEVISECR